MGRGSQVARKKQRSQLWKRDKQPDGSRICYLCGIVLSKSKFTLDHITPANNNGSNNLDNLAIACLECNQKKADSGLEKYLLDHPELLTGVARLKIKPESFKILMKMRGIRVRV